MAWSRRVGIEGNRTVKCFLAGSNSTFHDSPEGFANQVN
jgi:hypothetical protein